MNITVSNQLFHLIPDFSIGVIEYTHINVHQSSPEIQMNILEVSSKLASLESIVSIVGIKEYRAVFKKLGIDPSKYRPSSEAMIRRVMKKDTLPQIHSAADTNNLFSIQHRVPIGIYDLDKLSEPIEIRIGTNEDNYEGINNRQINMAQKLLSADKSGAFGSPIVDSKRTMVTTETKNALQLIYFYPEQSEHEKTTIIFQLQEYFTSHHGGESSSTIIQKKK